MMTKNNVMRNTIIMVVLGIFLLAGTMVYAAKPKENVSPVRHPNIAAAQKMIQNAFEKIVAAQKANEFDMEGHAQKAKELLEQASGELKLAAEAANKNKGK
jgi:F0F1-type ATP synthase membrane subunit b/b'